MEKLSGGKLIVQVEIVVKTDNTDNCNKQIASKFKLTNDMMKIQRENQLCDVVLNVKGKEFNAHKLMLVSRSLVFNRMFDTAMTESINNIVNITHINEDVLEEMLAYIYNGQVNSMICMLNQLLLLINMSSMI